MSDSQPTQQAPATGWSPDSVTSLGVQRVRTQRLGGITAVLLSLASALVLPFVLPASVAWVPVVLGLLGFLLSSSYLAGINRGPGERALGAGRVRRTESGWIVESAGHERVITREQVQTGWCEPTARGVNAVLQLKNGDLVCAHQPGEPAARALLTDAGVELAEQAVRMRMGRDDVGGRRLAAFFFVPFAMLGIPAVLGAFGYLAYALFAMSAAALAPALSALVSAGLFGGLMWWLGAKLVPAWIRVGADGVLLQKAIRKVFVSYADLESASVGGGPVYFRVLIRSKSGKVRRLPAATREQADLVVRQMEAAAAAFSDRKRAALIDGLARGTRSAQEWQGALHALMTDGDYRARSVDATQLLSIVEDPGLPADVRVAAAVALKPGAEPAAKKRIRIAAESSASPPVRVALEKAAAGEFPDAELAVLESESRRRAG